MTSDEWTWFWSCVCLFTFVMWWPVSMFIKALKRKREYLREKAKLEQEEIEFFDRHTSQATARVNRVAEAMEKGQVFIPPPDLSVNAARAAAGLSTHPPVYRVQPHRNKWVFIGRGTENVFAWPEYYEYACIGDYYCQDKLRMDIEPMWGYVPRINPYVAGFNRTRYKMRAEFLREAVREQVTLHYHAVALSPTLNDD